MRCFSYYRLIIAFALCALGALNVYGMCPTCGKANCPYDPGSGPIGIEAPAAVQHLQEQVLNKFIAEHPEYEQAVTDRRMSRDEALRQIMTSYEYQQALAVREAQDPDISQFRAKVIQKRVESIAAEQGRKFGQAPGSPQDYTRSLAKTLDNNPSMNNTRREIVAQSAALGQLMVTVAAGEMARSSPEAAARFVAGIQFDDKAKSEAVTIRAYAGNVIAAARKQDEAEKRIQALKEALPTADKRAAVMQFGGGSSELRRSVVENAALALEASAQSRERIGLTIVVPPPPKPNEAPASATRTIKDWGKQTLDQMEGWVVRIHHLYPNKPYPGGSK